MSTLTEKVTVDSIITFLKNTIEEKIVLPPAVWIDAAEKLNMLRSDEEDRLVGLMQKVAELKVKFIEEGSSVAMAKAKVEASSVHKDYLMQKMRCERIIEFIRIEKIRARMADDSYLGK